MTSSAAPTLATVDDGAYRSPGPLYPPDDFGPTDRRAGWIATVVVTAIAALTRFFMLGSPTDGGTPVFDEKHYAPQGWQVLTGGGWIEDNPAYGLVVHPPIGKWLIAFGEALFGYSGLGWRFASAVAGTLLVLLVVRIARRLTRSTLIGAIAGVLLICDGLTFVSSRMAMLDIFQALFVVGAFGALIVDRDQMRARLARAARLGPWTSDFGPRFGVRWWRFGAGVLLGLACGTKWSGIYFIAFFGLMSVAFDVAARRAYRVRRPWLGAAVRDVVPALGSLVGVPVVIYLLSYTPWFSSETGVYRHAVGTKLGDESRWSFIPDALRSLWYYQGGALKFHEGLTNSAGNHHPWESKPWTWPMSLRPMLYYFTQNEPGCEPGSCVRAVMAIGTPAMWWLAFPMLGWAAYSAVVRRDWRYATVLVGYGAGWLPWFTTLDRQMYFFYAVVMAPFLVLGLALVISDILKRGRRAAEQRTLRLAIVSAYVAIVVVNFVWLWPILTAQPISPEHWQQELWLPSWR